MSKVVESGMMDFDPALLHTNAVMLRRFEAAMHWLVFLVVEEGLESCEDSSFANLVHDNSL
jgi:hypothetical protein